VVGGIFYSFYDYYDYNGGIMKFFNQTKIETNMQKTRISVLSIFISCIILLYTNCEFQEVSPDEEALDAIVNQCVEDAKTIDRAIRCVPDPVYPEEREIDAENPTAVYESTEEIDGIQFKCSAKNWRGNENRAEFVSLNDYLDVLYAGNLVQGKHLLTGTLVQMSGERTGGTIVVEGITFAGKANAFEPPEGQDFGSTILENLTDEEREVQDEAGTSIGTISCAKKSGTAGPSYSCDVDEVNLSGMKEAREILLAQADAGTCTNPTYTTQATCEAALETWTTSATSANIYYEIEEGMSFNQIKASLGISAGYHGSLEITMKESITVLKYVQGYYTIVWQPKNNPTDYFTSEDELEVIKGNIGGGNPAAYISAVTYGRTIYVYLFSKENSTEVEGALNAGFGKSGESEEGTSGFNMNVNVSGSYANILNESRMVAFFVGGSAEDAALAITTGSGEGGVIDQVGKYITRGANYNSQNPGAPIAYSAKWLANNEPAKVSLMQDYVITECVPVDPNFRLAQSTELTESEYALKNAAGITMPSLTGEIFLYTLGGQVSSATQYVQKYSIDPGGDYEENSWVALDSNVLTMSNLSTLYLDSHTATALGTKVYLIGGQGRNAGSTNEPKNWILSMPVDNYGNLEYSSITTESVTLPEARYGHSALIANGFLYVIGGNNSSGSSTNTIYFNDLTDTGTLATDWGSDSLLIPVEYGAAFAKSKRLYVIGSGKVQYAEFKRNTAGEFTGSLKTFNESDIKDAEGNQIWLEQFGAVLIQDYIYIFGGSDAGDSSPEIYFAKINDDGSVGTWNKNTKPMEDQRYGHITINAGGLIYSVLGYADSATAVQSVETTGILAEGEE
jgi:hypothetical protein